MGRTDGRTRTQDSLIDPARECGNVTSAGWPVTLCDPMWHVSSRSGVATLRTAAHSLLTYLLTYSVYYAGQCQQFPVVSQVLNARTNRLINHLVLTTVSHTQKDNQRQTGKDASPEKINAVILSL